LINLPLNTPSGFWRGGSEAVQTASFGSRTNISSC